MDLRRHCSKVAFILKSLHPRCGLAGQRDLSKTRSWNHVRRISLVEELTAPTRSLWRAVETTHRPAEGQASPSRTITTKQTAGRQPMELLEAQARHPTFLEQMAGRRLASYGLRCVASHVLVQSVEGWPRHIVYPATRVESEACSMHVRTCRNERMPDSSSRLVFIALSRSWP